MTHVDCKSKVRLVIRLFLHPYTKSGWHSGMRSCIMPGLPTDSVQELNVGTVCMCVCIYGCVYMYVCLYECAYVCMYVCMYGCVYICMYVFMYVCKCVCMYVCMYVCNLEFRCSLLFLSYCGEVVTSQLYIVMETGGNIIKLHTHYTISYFLYCNGQRIGLDGLDCKF